MFYFFKKKKICKGKIKFCSVNADTKMSMSRFLNRVRKKHLNKQTVKFTGTDKCISNIVHHHTSK